MDISKQSLAQHVKLKCRVCFKEMYRKNYKSHLESSHPTENSDDLSPLGQIKISTFFQQKKQEVLPEVDVHEVAEEDPHYDGIDNNRKRRHESGESIESGYYDDNECPTSGSSDKRKRYDMENQEEVTLKTLNVKLDNILEKVSVNTSAAAEKSTSKQHNSDSEVPAVLTWIKHTRSMAEILEGGFEYEEDSGLLSCSVCGDDNVAGTFYYSAENGLEFDE